MFALAETLTKCSLLALTYRILSSKGLYAYVIIAAAVIIVAQGFVFIIVCIFTCRYVDSPPTHLLEIHFLPYSSQTQLTPTRPPSHYWHLSLTPQPECISQTAHLLAAGCINCVTDFLVVALPIPTVLSLKFPRRQQIIVVGLFCVGFTVTIAGAVRTYYTRVATNWYDISWDVYPVWITSSTELFVGMVSPSAFIPGIPPNDQGRSRRMQTDENTDNSLHPRH